LLLFLIGSARWVIMVFFQQLTPGFGHPICERRFSFYFPSRDGESQFLFLPG